MDDLIKRSDVIEALNDCEYVKGFAYKALHDAIMEIPAESSVEGEAKDE